jgi:hypothetical protein
VQFFSNTINADSLNWDFGNGTVSMATNPTIQYGSSGNFTVSLVASNSCARDTFSQTLAIGINAISENLNPHGSLLFPNPNSGKFLLLGEIPFREFSILNAIGTEIPFTIHENGEVVLEDPIPGIYFLRDKSKFRFKPVIFFVSE